MNQQISLDRGSFTTEQITSLVYGFYVDIEGDTLLRPIFQNAIGTNWDFHLMRIVCFWCTLMLQTRSFKGNILETHLRIPDLKVEHFSRWLSLWHCRTFSTFPDEKAVLLQRAAERVARTIFAERFGYVPGFKYLGNEVVIESVGTIV